MKITHSVSRREFLAANVAVGSTLALANCLTARAAETERVAPAKHYKIIGFSKPFRDFGPEQTADLVAEVGWDGIECPIRSRDTHIEPTRVEEDLPRMVEALQKRGKEVTLVTTDITKLNPAAEKILRAMAKLGIKTYRLGFEKYPPGQHPSKKLTEFGAALKDLAAFNQEIGLRAGYQNHSGENYVGAPVWDLWTIMKNLDPKQMGVCFDIAHATIEGGLSWPIEARLMQPHFVSVFCKDFRWENGAKDWSPSWCPFGGGTVQKRFFDWLRTTDFDGPLSQHHEYESLGKGQEMILNLKKDLATLRDWLSAAQHQSERKEKS